jgi:hypothetical protein
MAEGQEPKQTTPKGVEIPVPKREDFLRDLKKVAPPKPEPAKRDGEQP